MAKKAGRGTRQLAQIIGPILSVMTLSEMINFSIWEINLPSVTFLNGVLLFAGGISILRVHNLWVLNWPVLITLIGWITIILGSLRMFFPSAQQVSENFPMYLLLAVLFAIGLFLTLKGYYPNKSSSD